MERQRETGRNHFSEFIDEHSAKIIVGTCTVFTIGLIKGGYDIAQGFRGDIESVDRGIITVIAAIAIPAFAIGGTTLIATVLNNSRIK